MIHERKRLKKENERMLNISNTVMTAQEERNSLLQENKKLIIEQQISEKKFEMHEKFEITFDPKRNDITKHKLNKIEDEKLQKIVTNVLQGNPNLILMNSKVPCTICEKNWKATPDIHSKPICDFAIHRNLKQAIQKHKKSNVHKHCFQTKINLTSEEKRLRNTFDKEETLWLLDKNE